MGSIARSSAARKKGLDQLDQLWEAVSVDLRPATFNGDTGNHSHV